jgi:hypothetical protein
MLTAAPGRKTAEAAQANRGGLECSSYTWQVRRREHAVSMAESQAESGPYTARCLTRRDIYHNIISVLDCVAVFRPVPCTAS